MSTNAAQRPAEPEVLRCNSTADFLAALPRLIGFTATNSLFVVLFAGRRAQHAIRIDLPASESPADSIQLLDFVCDSVRDFSEVSGTAPEPALVVSSAQTFADAGGTPWRRLAKRIDRRLRREQIRVRDFCCIAPDGWASYLISGDPRHPLDEISASPLSTAPTPDLSTLGELPVPDLKRVAKIERWFEKIGPYDFPSAGSPSPPTPALGEPSWCSETASVARALRDVDFELSPGMTVRLARSAAHPARWFALALGLLTRPEFPEDIAREMGTERFERIALDLDADPSAYPTSDWSIPGLLARLCPDFTEFEQLRGVRERLHIALSEVPEAHRPGLYAFSAWVWWLTGNQSVALKQVDSAFAIDPHNELALMVARLVSAPRALARLCEERASRGADENRT